MKNNNRAYVRIYKFGGARNLIVTVVGNRHGVTSSKPGRDCLHFPIGKGIYPTVLLLAIGKL